MIYLMFFLSAAVTGALFAFGARVQGIEHSGALFAIGIIGAGVQMLILIIWYLHHTRARDFTSSQRQDPEIP